MNTVVQVQVQALVQVQCYVIRTITAKGNILVMVYCSRLINVKELKTIPGVNVFPVRTCTTKISRATIPALQKYNASLNPFSLVALAIWFISSFLRARMRSCIESSQAFILTTLAPVMTCDIKLTRASVCRATWVRYSKYGMFGKIKENSE